MNIDDVVIKSLNTKIVNGVIVKNEQGKFSTGFQKDIKADKILRSINVKRLDLV